MLVHDFEHFTLIEYEYFIMCWFNFHRSFKGIYLSKALTFMKFFLYKQKCFFCQEDRYLWPHCCMNNLYISHRSIYAPTYSFRAIHNMLISILESLPGLIPFTILWQAGWTLDNNSCMDMNYNYPTTIFRLHGASKSNCLHTFNERLFLSNYKF